MVTFLAEYRRFVTCATPFLQKCYASLRELRRVYASATQTYYGAFDYTVTHINWMHNHVLRP